MEIQTKILESNELHNKDVIKIIVDKLNKIFFKLPERSRLDDFESRLDNYMVDIAQELGLILDFKIERNNTVYVFKDPLMA